MSEASRDLLSLLIREVQSRDPDCGEAEALAIIVAIISHNFPKCLDKYLKGEEWKL